MNKYIEFCASDYGLQRNQIYLVLKYFDKKLIRDKERRVRTVINMQLGRLRACVLENGEPHLTFGAASLNLKLWRFLP